MIDFKYLETNKKELREKYLSASPFPHLVLKDLLDSAKLHEMLLHIPLLDNKSRDYMFANNKFEKAKYYELHPFFKELYEDLRSPAMSDFLSYLSGKSTFVDPMNHGGGLHQGRENSFLNMHLDYNYHPNHESWWREMNILIYLNSNWRQEYGGHLKLRDLRTDEERELDVDFNTIIIQQCSDYSLHGYDMTSFPKGSFRTSIATYAFTEHKRKLYPARTTDWFVDDSEANWKKWLGRNISSIIKVKTRFLGSGTGKNV